MPCTAPCQIRLPLAFMKSPLCVAVAVCKSGVLSSLQIPLNLSDVFRGLISQSTEDCDGIFSPRTRQLQFLLMPACYLVLQPETAVQPQ